MKSTLHFRSVCLHILNLEHKRSGGGLRSQKNSEPAAFQNSDWDGDERANSISDSELDPEDTSDS